MSNESGLRPYQSLHLRRFAAVFEGHSFCWLWSQGKKVNLDFWTSWLNWRNSLTHEGMNKRFVFWQIFFYCCKEYLDLLLVNLFFFIVRLFFWEWKPQKIKPADTVGVKDLRSTLCSVLPELKGNVPSPGTTFVFRFESGITRCSVPKVVALVWLSNGFWMHRLFMRNAC